MTEGIERDFHHRYRWNGGPWVPGVTGTTKMLDKSDVLTGWAKREVAAAAARNLDILPRLAESGGPQAVIEFLKGIPGYQRDTAADLGSRVHALAEATAKGEPVEVTDEERPFVERYREFLETHRPEFKAVEAMVYSERHGYGGTLDAIAAIRGELWILDIKTAKGVYAETALQLMAYARADFIGKANDPRRYRIPKVTRYGVIHLRPEHAHLVEYTPTDATWRAFLACLELLRWREGEARTVQGKRQEAVAA